MAVSIELIDTDRPNTRILRQAASAILGGKVIACPTDTGYAFAANAINPKAVTKVFNLKGRSYSNPIHIAVNSVEMAERYAYMNKIARCLAYRFLPGALTLVLPKKDIVPVLLVAGRSTVGIRIPDNRIMLDLISMTNVPLTATSANTSRKPAPYSVQEILCQLGKTAEILALVLDQGPLPTRDVSTIVDLTVEPPLILRHGRVNEQEVLMHCAQVRNQIWDY